MAERANHPDFDAAPAEEQWIGDLPELVEKLRHEAYALKGEWAWRVLPRGALVAMCVPQTFRKQVRFARRLRKGLTDKTAEAWHAEVTAYLEQMGYADWKVVKDVIEPGEPPKLEAIYEEPVPLSGARKAPLVCVRCGGVAEPGSEKYAEIICNRCALQAGSETAAALNRVRAGG